MERAGVTPALLANINDNTPLTATDREPFYRFLAAPAVSTSSTSPTDTVLPLFQNPANQRGRIFRLFGTISRVRRIEIDDPAIRTNLKMDHYFEVDFVTADSQGNPLIACVANLPPGITATEDCREPMEITAVFFKLWQYPAALSEFDPTDLSPATASFCNRLRC